MTEHWNEHSLDFSRSSDRKFDSTEGTWDENKTGFTIDTNEDDDMENRRKVYAEPNPTITNLQDRQKYTNQVRNDKSYRFLMMVAAFSKKKLGTVMNVKQKSKPTTKTTTTYDQHGRTHTTGYNDRTGFYKSAQNIDRKEETKEYEQCNEDASEDGACELAENTGKIGGQAWLTMPEISGSIQLTPEVYGHIMEAQMIVGSFTKQTIKLKTLVEDTPYQTLFARLVAIRMGLTKYFDSSDKQKDKIFSRLHQEQTMLLRRIRTVKGEPTKDYTYQGGY
jgi:hypothetical protein